MRHGRPRLPFTALRLLFAGLTLGCLWLWTLHAGAQEGRLDLNTATLAQLDALPGIGPSKAQAILTHRAERGPFKTPRDLLQVEGIGASTLARLCPMLQASGDTTCPAPSQGNAEEVVEVIDADEDPRVNINIADTATLQALPGIGEKRAAMIIERRQSVGPFKRPEELREIKGIGEKTLEKLLPFVRTTARVNQVTREELLATQAVTPAQADAILAYRKRVGRLLDVEQLKETPGLPAACYMRLAVFLEP